MMHHAALLCLAVPVIPLTLGIAATAADSPGVPWQAEMATHRQVIALRTPVPRRDAVAAFELAAPAAAALRILDVEADNSVLPAHRSGRTVTVRLPGPFAGVRRIAAYWSDGPGFAAGPALPDAPVAGDDYATDVHGRAWDFADGTQCGIRSWGDGPEHIGAVAVRDGVLVIPVTGKDPYWIWGVMFSGEAPVREEDCERIDSARYVRLRLRLRQSCARAVWALYVTDRDGVYRGHRFTVTGSDFQTVALDLPEIFPQFWDGRILRALRLDPTEDSPGTTVEIDWVRLEPPDPVAAVGPVCTPAEVAQRAGLRGFGVEAPAAVEAGSAARFAWRGVQTFGPATRADAVVLVGELRDAAGVVVARAEAPLHGAADGSAGLSLPVGTVARDLDWVVGCRDDLGNPAAPAMRGRMRVTPARLDHYSLVPEQRFLPANAARTTMGVSGMDRFGNPMPIDAAANLAVDVDNGGKVTVHRLPAGGCELRVTGVTVPLTRHTVTCRDQAGITGSCSVVVVGTRRDPVAVTPNGWITVGGKLFLPLGGFYANWPSGRPGRDGAVSRSVDLFPCNAIPYPHGFPWPAEVEQKVGDYLDLCREHGVTALRLMLRNMDIVGRVDAVQLQAVLHLFDLGRARGLRFNVALFEDYDKPPYVNPKILESIALPHYTAAELAALPPHRARFLVEKRVLGNPAQRYVDADARRCQQDYLEALIPVLAGRDEVFCYEFENEMVHPPMAWCRDMAAVIRAIDPNTPILGNPGPHAWPEPWRWRDSGVDLFSYHPYNDGMPGADHGAVLFARSKWAAAAGIPFFTGEGGIDQNRWQPDVPKVGNAVSQRGCRDQIWLSLACGANGAFLWTACFDAEMAEFGKVTTALTALGVDLLRLERRRPRVAVTMPDHDRANAAACRLAWDLLSRGVDFDARPATADGGYAVRLEPGAAASEALPRAEFFEPGEGWQAAALVSASADQALVYLRNVAGGRRNVGGDRRPCWVRTPDTATPRLRLHAATWGEVRAFDLDAGALVPVTREPGAVTLPSSAHDYVLSFR